jgi:hypothetical protein
MSIVRGLVYVFFLGLWAGCGGTTAGPTESLDGGGAAGTGGSGGTAGAGGSAGGTGGTAGTCGGQKCAFGQRCAHDMCGAPDSEGHCRDVPLDCLEPPSTWRPVCDCKANVWPFSCGEFDTAPAERCTEFPCGGSKCAIATQYCERQVSDVGGVPDTYTCKPLPASCMGAPSCTCVRSEPCGGSCQGNGPLGLMLTCPGG